MSRILVTVIASLAQCAVLFWFFAPYNTDTIKGLPSRNAKTFLLAALVVFLSGLWLRLGPSPIATKSFRLIAWSYSLVEAIKIRREQERRRRQAN